MTLQSHLTHAPSEAFLQPALRRAREELDRRTCSANRAEKLQLVGMGALDAWAAGHIAKPQTKRETRGAPAEEVARRSLLLDECLRSGSRLHARLSSMDAQNDGLASRATFVQAARDLGLDRRVVHAHAAALRRDRPASRVPLQPPLSETPPPSGRAGPVTGTGALSSQARSTPLIQQRSASPVGLPLGSTSAGAAAGTEQHGEVPLLESLFDAFDLGTPEGFISYAELDAHLRRHGQQRRAAADARREQRATMAVARMRNVQLARGWSSWYRQHAALLQLRSSLAWLTLRINQSKLQSAVALWKVRWAACVASAAAGRARHKRDDLEAQQRALREGLPLSVRNALARDQKRRHI